MAHLVSVIGVSHSPYLPNIFAKYPNIAENDRLSFENYQRMHDRLDASKPDVIITVGSDHFNNFFLEDMPPFIIGKNHMAKGPHPNEVGSPFNIPTYEARVDVDLAKTLITEGFRHRVDFAFSDKLYIEHSIALPMSYIRPEMDLPIVPLFCNVLAPPIPPGERFLQVGEAISQIVDEMPSNTRVAVVASGHLAIDVGGPLMGEGSVDPDWDRRVVGLIRDGDTAGVLAESSWDNLNARGTVTPGFLNFLLLVGMARGAKPSYAEVNVSGWHGSTPFFLWD